MASEWKGMSLFRRELMANLNELLDAGIVPTSKLVLEQLISNRGVLLSYSWMKADDRLFGMYVDMRSEGLREMIFVRAGLNDEQLLKTLTHELAHYFTLRRDTRLLGEKEYQEVERMADVLGNDLLETTNAVIASYHKKGHSPLEDGPQFGDLLGCIGKPTHRHKIQEVTQ